MSGYTHGTPGTEAQQAYDARMKRAPEQEPDPEPDPEPIPELDPIRGILDYTDIPSWK